MSRRTPHLEAIWPETAECSSMRRRTLHNSKNSKIINQETLGIVYVFSGFENKGMVAGTY